jgi:hypothetical protein
VLVGVDQRGQGDRGLEALVEAQAQLVEDAEVGAEAGEQDHFVDRVQAAPVLADQDQAAVGVALDRLGAKPRDGVGVSFVDDGPGGEPEGITRRELVYSASTEGEPRDATAQDLHRLRARAVAGTGEVGQLGERGEGGEAGAAAKYPVTSSESGSGSAQPLQTGCGLSARRCVIGGMAIELGKPGVDGLSEAVTVLREWQHDGAPMQLHPGDLGWFWRFGAEATAAAVRTWSRDGQILAVGLLDGPELLRLTIAPDAQRDEELAQQLLEDLAEPERGVLGQGKAYVEAPMGASDQEGEGPLRPPQVSRPFPSSGKRIPRHAGLTPA